MKLFPTFLIVALALGQTMPAIADDQDPDGKFAVASDSVNACGAPIHSTAPVTEQQDICMASNMGYGYTPVTEAGKVAQMNWEVEQRNAQLRQIQVRHDQTQPQEAAAAAQQVGANNNTGAAVGVAILGAILGAVLSRGFGPPPDPGRVLIFKRQDWRGVH
jgi:hypothetical protein